MQNSNDVENEGNKGSNQWLNRRGEVSRAILTNKNGENRRQELKRKYMLTWKRQASNV